MSASVAEWNALADAWLRWLVDRAVVASVALLVVGAVLALLRGRLSAHAPSHLLLLPALLLVAPLERALPTAWPGALPAVVSPHDAPPKAPNATTTAADGASVAAATGPAADLHAAAADGAPAPAAAPNAAAIALAVWLLGIAACALRLARAQRAADAALMRSGRRPGRALQALFDRLCSERGFDAAIALRVVPGLASPVATGVLRRAVCVPPGLDERLTTTQLRFVLLHELEHHARRDVLAEAALRLCRAAFWFHPVTWIVLAAHRRWREYACDEAAVARAGAHRRTPVADALFTLIHLANDAPRPRGAVASFAPSLNVMKTRLRRILDRTRSPRRSLTATSLLLVAATGLGALTLARAQVPGDPVRVRRPQDPVAEARPQKPDGEVAIAIDQGIAWLLAAQQPDGSWDIGPDPAGRTARDHNEAHVTGLALRAVLLGYKGPRHLEVVAAVERGDDYLRGTQNEVGLFGGGEPMAEAYGHAQVLRALCAVQRVIPDDQRLASITRGVAYAEKVRNPYAGWRYRPRDNDNDSKHTALMLLALLDARELGVEVSQRAFECGRLTLDELTAPDTGRTGFVRRGSEMSRFVTKIKKFPPRYSEEPTAMRLLVEAAFADGMADEDVLARAADVVRAVPPVWDTDAGSIDYAYWCFGARAMATVDDPGEWREKLHAALLPNRIVDGDKAHWPANDAWSRPGMEAYSTASCVLALNGLL